MAWKFNNETQRLNNLYGGSGSDVTHVKLRVWPCFAALRNSSLRHVCARFNENKFDFSCTPREHFRLVCDGNCWNTFNVVTRVYRSYLLF
jgi:hypothetical protein